jgi:hypothetical protein
VGRAQARQARPLSDRSATATPASRSRISCRWLVTRSSRCSRRSRPLTGTRRRRSMRPSQVRSLHSALELHGRKDDRLELAESRQEIAATWRALSGLEREVVALRFAYGLTQREIGQRVGYCQNARLEGPATGRHTPDLLALDGPRSAPVALTSPRRAEVSATGRHCRHADREGGRLLDSRPHLVRVCYFELV